MLFTLNLSQHNHSASHPRHPLPIHPKHHQNTNISLREPISSAQSNRNTQNPPLDKNQSKTFKIRTFSTKAPSMGQKVIGKKITNEINTSCKQQEDVFKSRQANFNRRPSVHLNDNSLLDQKKKEVLKKKNRSKQSIFNDIQIKQTGETLLNFKRVDLTKFSLLSHRPILYCNQFTSIQNPKFIMIISFAVISSQPKRFFKSFERCYSSQRSAEATKSAQSTLEPVNLLKLISGEQNNQSFLKCCRVYYKVSSDHERIELMDYLKLHNLNQYEGIINVRSKYAEQLNIYSLKDIANQESKIIIVEQDDVLKSEIPLLEGQETVFLTINTKTSNFQVVSQLFKSVKEVKIMPEERKQEFQISINEDQQNIHPNIQKSCVSSKMNFKCSNSNISPMKHKEIIRKMILSVNTCITKLDLSQKYLEQKAEQALKIKRIKHIMRERDNSVNISIIEEQKGSKETIKSRINSLNKPPTRTKEDNPFVIQLEGNFKEKMIKFAKILEAQRSRELGQVKSISKDRNQNKNDDLEEMTLILTSRLKSKTPFQMVGDLLRNNSHIARQIGNFINSSIPLGQFLQKKSKMNTQILNQGRGNDFPELILYTCL